MRSAVASWVQVFAQWALIIVSALVVFLPSVRTSTMQAVTSALFLVFAVMHTHRMWREGWLKLTPAEVHARFKLRRAEPHGRSVVRPLETLAIFLGLIAMGILAFR